MMTSGALRLVFERRAAQTIVTGCRWTLPVQVLAPVALSDPAAVVSILNPTGVLLGGDRVDIQVCVGAGAHACLTTPSATKISRSAGEVTRQRVTIRVDREGIAEWVPEHTIPFAGAAVCQSLDVELAAGARAIVVDAWAAGRVARGEAWCFALVDSALTVRDAAGLLVVDRFVLERGRGGGLGGAEGFPYFFTLIAAGAGDLDAFSADARERLAQLDDDVQAGVGATGGRARVVRGLARSAPALLDAVATIWACARRSFLGVAPLALRKP
jgi:urease accessory protein